MTTHHHHQRTTMKRILITTAILFAGLANATDKTHIPTTKPGQTGELRSNASAQAGATSGSVSGSKAVSGPSSAAVGPVSSNSTASTGPSSAASGDSTSGANNSLGAIGTDNSSSSFRALALSLPAAAFTPPLPMGDGNCTNTEQDAGAGGWNFASYASAKQSTDNCVAIKLHDAYLRECQYASAKQIKDRLAAKVLPGFTPSARVALDLTERECRDLQAPVLPPPAPANVVYQPAPVRACVVQKPVVKRKVVAPGVCR